MHSSLWAGLLLLCYGQALARMVRLKTADVIADGARTSIRFGKTEVDLKEPIGELVRELICHRVRATTGDDHRLNLRRQATKQTN